MSDGGKGSAPRPFTVTQDVFVSNWEKTFGKKSDQPVEGEQRINKLGQLEQYVEGYWQELENFK